MEDKIIINVGRQIGSGGHIIAQRLAELFSCRLYDREILNLAAKESGFSEKYFEQNDERRGILKSLSHVHLPFVSDNNFYRNNFSPESLFQFQSEAILKAAENNSCVFVGRCADYVLRNMNNVTNLFITADFEERTKHVCERLGCNHEEAVKIIRKGEEERATYYNYYTGKKWGAAASYDMCINTSILGFDKTVEMIVGFIKEKDILTR